MTVVLVEGESDRIAVEVLAERRGVRLPTVVVTGGAGGARRAVAALGGEPTVGLVDTAERDQMSGFVAHLFVCTPDLEGELVRALGIDAVLEIIEAQGEGASFRRLQHQPAQRGRPVEAHLRKFFGGRSGNKPRYARLLAGAVPLDRVPAPLDGVLQASAV